MYRSLLFRLLSGLTLLFLASGCGPATATIQGEVAVDDAPLEKGVIVFAPADANGGAPVTGTIDKGHYRVVSTPGNKYVQISAPRVIERVKESKAPNAPMVERTEESLPEQYNAKSELRFEAKEGSNTKDWALQLKPPTP
jgi:hypothetical protein